MNYDEEAMQFLCGDESLVGILTVPDEARSTGVLVVVGGPQYRVGSHRQFALLSRDLASHGFAVLRFDVRGMGDSSGSSRDFRDVSEDISAAIATLQQRVPAVTDVVLWGLCDAAAAALLYCVDRRDTRVRGLCLINPWVRSPASEARTLVRHYYAQRLVEPDFWAKLLRGQVGGASIKELVRNFRRAGRDDPDDLDPPLTQSFQQRMAIAWRSFKGPMLLVLSGRDYTAKEFVDLVECDDWWSGAFNHPRMTRHHVPDADHTFSEATARTLLQRHTLEWLQGEAW